MDNSSQNNHSSLCDIWSGKSKAALDSLVVSMVVVSILIIESMRLVGILVPLPFFVLFGAIVLAASLGGLRIGIVSATLVAGYGTYAMLNGFGPVNVNLDTAQFAGTLLTAFVVITVIGHQRDKLGLLASSSSLYRESQVIEAPDERRRRAQADQFDSTASNLIDDPCLFENAVRNSPAGVILIGTNNRIECINPAALQQFHLETLPDAWRDVAQFIEHVQFYTPDGEKYTFEGGPLADVLRDGKITDDFNCKIVRADGTDGWFRGCFSPTRSDTGEITGAIVVLLDVRDKIAAKRALQQLARRLLVVQEEERTRFAYYLNDEIAQDLAAIKMMMHVALRTGESDNLAKESIARINALLDSVSHLSMEIRPAALDDLGLVSALRWYLSRQISWGGLTVTFDANISVPNLPPETAIACFRLAQEAVTNTVRHAGAQSLVVRMSVRNAKLLIEIIDDGCGFDVDQAFSDETQVSGFGLIAMRERTKLAHGHFSIESAPDQGTTVSAWFPSK